jgi:hypothetical protein
VSWQDELRALDEKLSAGMISAEEYRRGRDEIVTKSMQNDRPSEPTNLPPAGEPSNPAAPTAVVPQAPGPQWTVESPFAPTTVHPPAPTGPGGPDQTMVVKNPGDADRTQVVRGPSAQPGPFGAPPQGGGWQAQPSSPWGNQPSVGNSAPPWGSSEFEPIQAARESWLRQGPEAFDSGSSKKGKIFAVIGVVVVLVGLAVYGIVYLTNNQPSSSVATGPTGGPTTVHTVTKPPLPLPPPSKAAPVDTQSALIDPPGTPRDGGGPVDLTSLSTNNLLPKPMIDALTQAGMTDGLLKTTIDNGTTIGIYALAVRGQSDASTVAHVYAGIQQNGGVPADERHAMQGVPVFSTPAGGPSVFRTVYVLYNRVVILETLGTDRVATEQLFTRLLHDQVSLAPPTVRKF